MRRASLLFGATAALGVNLTTFALTAQAHEPAAKAAQDDTNYAKQIANASSDRDRILDDLYATYGDGETSRQLQRDTGTGTSESDHDVVHDLGRDVKQGASRIIADVDRATFDAQCRRVGHGQKPILPSDRQSAFFAQPSVIAQCDQVARLDLQIEQLRSRE